jgi:hypothetical protein
MIPMNFELMALNSLKHSQHSKRTTASDMRPTSELKSVAVRPSNFCQLDPDPILEALKLRTGRYQQNALFLANCVKSKSSATPEPL